MGMEQLISKIEEQQAVYHALKAGDAGAVCYKEFQNGEWGTDDENYVNRLRLFKDILEACFEVTANDAAIADGLWNWAKPELQKVPQSGRYGNLYTKGIAAAKAMNDPYGKELEQEYENFLAGFQSLRQ